MKSFLHTFITLLLFLSVSYGQASDAIGFNGIMGFATYSDMGLNGTTGGGNGKVVHVSSRQELETYATGSTPYVIIIDQDIEGKGMDVKDVIAIGSNKTIIGAGSGKALRGICIDMKDQQNVIFRNLSISRGNDDAIAMRNCHHIWIDHCDLSDSYDGLLDFTLASDYITVSWTKLHDHDKVSITNSGTCHFEDYGREHITFAHCWFANNVQRNPRIGYGRMHIYNCYWTNISSYCIGFHSQAQVLSENNHFTKTANHPFNNQYTNVLPYCGYLTDRGSFFANGDPGNSYSQKFKGISYTPLTYYEYDFDLLPTDNVEASILEQSSHNVGPFSGIEHEPILCPGNGAIDIPVTQRLSWGNVDGATSYVLCIGTERGNMQPIDVDKVELKPATTYYWTVEATTAEGKSISPVHQFTTAASAPVKPYPADGQQDPWLRWPAEAGKYCVNMPLTWRPAADAASYKVYVGTKEPDLEFIGETKTLSISQGLPEWKVGTKYYWRVDAIGNDGTVHKGETWSFESPKAEWTATVNEVEDGYMSGIAFKLKDGNMSDDYCVRGDQGPGSITGVFSGAAGRYAITTTYQDMVGGKTQMAVSINGKIADEWIAPGTSNSLVSRHTRRTVMLNPGDEIRIDYIAGFLNGVLANEGYGKIDVINIVKADADTVEVKRQSGIYHAPVATTGYDHELLRTSDFMFRDSLGTVGNYNELQVRDDYCSWITKTEDCLKIYVRNAELVVATSGSRGFSIGKEEVYHRADTLDFNKSHVLTYPYDETMTLRLYKSLPKDTVYHSPVVAEGEEWELTLSPDAVFTDSHGIKGVAGKVQVRDGYDLWMKYYNPTANEVQSSTERKAFISPWNDGSYGRVISGADGSKVSYVVGVDKNMNYFIKDCSKAKIYYTGSGGAATYMNLIVMASDGSMQTIAGGDATGKGVKSNTVETTLDPSLCYQLRAIAPSDGGDICIYALKLWHGNSDGIREVTTTKRNSGKTYNLSGQVVGNSYRGLIIKDGKKMLKK